MATAPRATKNKTPIEEKPQEDEILATLENSNQNQKQVQQTHSNPAQKTVTVGNSKLTITNISASESKNLRGNSKTSASQPDAATQAQSNWEKSLASQKSSGFSCLY